MAHIELLPDRILVVRLRPGIAQSVPEAEENVAAMRDLVRSGSVPVLVDLRESGPVSRAARAIYAQSDIIEAHALVVDSAFTRVAANLFMRLGRTRYPNRMFNDEDAALSWLRSYL